MSDLFQYDPNAETSNAQKLYSGGEDTVKLSLWVDWSGADISALASELQRLKNKAQHPTPNEEPEPFQTMTFSYVVKPVAMNPAKREYTHLPYYLTDGGIAFGIRFTDATSKEAHFNVRVEIGSLPLIVYRLEEVWAEIEYRLEQMGGKILRTCLSRVDLCVDLPGVSPTAFVEALLHGNVICRARKKRYFNVLDIADSDSVELGLYQEGVQKTGISIGAGNILLRIYEKIRESQNREDKLLALVEHRFGELPEVATRVEFELKSEALRNLTILGKADFIHTLEDWFLCRTEIMEYLCNHWVRFLKPGADKHNTDRLTEEDYLPEWQSVLSLFRSWMGEALCTVDRTVKRVKMTCETYLRQIVGLFAACFVASGHDIYARDRTHLKRKFLVYAREALRRVTLDEDCEEDLEFKIKRARMRRCEKSPRSVFMGDFYMAAPIPV